MMLDEHFWYFDSVLTPRFCENVIKFGLQQKEQLARTGGYGERKLNKKEILNLKQKRNSDVVFLNEEWIYREIHPYINRANEQAGWNFKWEHSESIQFTKYKPNEFYTWHSDDLPKSFGENSHPNYHGKIRKLSATVNLTDPSEYTGGDFEIDLRNNEHGRNIVTLDQIKPKGSLLVFPSFVTHQVRPVRTGERTSLVIWSLGPPWR